VNQEQEHSVIGILGGMGPEASADLYSKLIDRFYRSAGDDMQGYPHLVINNIPLPNLFQQRGKAVGRYLGQECQRLERAGANVIAMACNSAYLYLDDVRSAVSGSTVVIDLIAEVARKLEQDDRYRIGVLSTAMSRPLYVQALTQRHRALVLPNEAEQQRLETIISHILSGRKEADLKQALTALSETLVGRSADCIVLGCTDLSLLMNQGDLSHPLYSSTDVLADVLFDYASGAQSVGVPQADTPATSRRAL